MCTEKELTVRDAIMESLYEFWKLGQSRQLMVPMQGCPEPALSRIITVCQSQSASKHENAKKMLCAACRSLEEFEEEFEPDYIAEGDDGDEALEAVYDLRLLLLDLVEGDCI